jgi:Domain of unknown function (DUF5666)
MNKVSALLALSLVLAACGTTATTPVAVAPTQTISGTITALTTQSMTVAGQTLKFTATAGVQSLAAQSVGAQSESSASGSTKVRVNGDDSNDRALSIGQHVSVKASGGEAAEVDIDQEVRGVIESVDVVGKKIVIAGQSIQVAANARIELSRADSKLAETKHTLADLTKGAFAEVTGSRDAAGLLTATSIEVRSSTERREQGEKDGADAAEVHGRIADLDAAAKTFTALGTKVNYGAATVMGTPVGGAEVEVKGSYDQTSKVLTATRVKIETEHGNEHGAPAAGSAVQFEEKVRSLDAAAKTLVAGHFKVDFSKATVTGTPAVKAEVNVVGTVDATDAALVHATAITFRADD